MLLMELNRILHRISFWRLESLYEAASLEPVLDSLSHGVESSASENVYSTAPSSKGPTVCLYNNLQSGVMPTSTTSGLATKSSRQQGFDVTILQRSASCMQERDSDKTQRLEMKKLPAPDIFQHVQEA